MKCQPNEGKIDRIIRIVSGILAILIGFSFLTGGFKIILYVGGVVLVMTGLVGYCGLYSLLNFTTLKKKE